MEGFDSKDLKLHRILDVILTMSSLKFGGSFAALRYMYISNIYLTMICIYYCFFLFLNVSYMHDNVMM